MICNTDGCSGHLIRHGSQARGPRWRCAQCGTVKTGRLPGTTGCHLGKGVNVGRFMSALMRPGGNARSQVCHDLGMSATGFDQQLSAVAKAVEARFAQRFTPGTQSGLVVHLSVGGTSKQIAVGKGRGGRFRVIAFPPHLPLAFQSWVQDTQGTSPEAQWLQAVLAPGLTENNMDDRLWVILGRTNAYPLS